MPLYYAAYLIMKVQKFSRLGSDISTTAEPLCDIVRECMCMHVCQCVCVCVLLSESNCVLASVHVCVCLYAF